MFFFFFYREGINLRREIGMKYNECEIMTGQVVLGPQMYFPVLLKQELLCGIQKTILKCWKSGINISIKKGINACVAPLYEFLKWFLLKINHDHSPKYDIALVACDN